MAPHIDARLHVLEGGSDNQSILVSRALWNQLDSDNDSVTVSVHIPGLVAPLPVGTEQRAPCKSFLAYAQCHPKDHGDASLVYIGDTMLTSIFGVDALSRLDEEQQEDDDTVDESAAAVHISRVALVELDEVILGALDQRSYDYAQQQPDDLVGLLQSPLVVRGGSKYTVQGYSYRVLMTSPVQQGHVLSASTKLFVVDMIDEEEEDDEDDEDDKEEQDQEVVSPSLALHVQDESKQRRIHDSHEFTAKILTRPWPEARLFPRVNAQQDEEARLFVDVHALAQLQVFSGDWVLVSGDDSKKSRLCQVFGVDLGSSDEKHVYVPPVLYYNLGLALPPSSETPILCLTRLAVRPPANGPPLASAVTIARIACPSLMDKSLQGAFLDALRGWFEGKDRIVCQGDILCIPLDEEAVRLGKSTAGQATTLGYFKVTQLESDDKSNDSIHPSYFGHGRRIVPSETQLVQTGVEASRIAIGHLSLYYNLVDKLPLHRAPMQARQTLTELVTSSLHPLGRNVSLSCNALVHGPRGGGKASLIRQVAEEMGVHLYELSIYNIVSDTDAKTEVHLRAKFEKAASLAPCVILMRNLEALAKKSAVVETGQEPLLATVLQECIQVTTSKDVPVMVMATTSDIEQLPSSVLGCFRHEVVMEAPDEATRLSILSNLIQDCPLAPDVSLPSLATQTAALVAKDLVDLVARTGVLALQRIQRIVPSTTTTQDIHAAGIALTAADFDAALNAARASYSDSIGAPKIPSVTWDDVGGMAHVKDDILDTIQLPLEHPELFGAGLKKRSGILLYGPPGTGKTLLAKAIATSCSLNFFSVKGPELLNMYIGESEANVRRVFQRARDAKPCVIFFDELDSVAPKRGEKGDSGGVMDRIVSQLLAELDGMSDGSSGAGDVFVIGATNRPDLLDPALLRPGRFDKLLYLGVSDTHEAQLRIIEALTRKFRLHPDLDLARVAEQCPFHYTGADFYALCTDAMLKAMTRVASTIDDKVKEINTTRDEPMTAQYFLSHLAQPEDIVVQVEEVDFIKALDELIPSVSATELAHYSRVREKFEKVEDDNEENEENDELLSSTPSLTPNGSKLHDFQEKPKPTPADATSPVTPPTETPAVTSNATDTVHPEPSVADKPKDKGKGRAHEPPKRKDKGKGKARA